MDKKITVAMSTFAKLKAALEQLSGRSEMEQALEVTDHTGAWINSLTATEVAHLQRTLAWRAIAIAEEEEAANR